MSTRTGEPDSTTANSNFPEFPGENFLAHAAAQFKEKMHTALADKGLLATAQGGEHASVKAIVDVDLALLPSLPPGDREHHRREETRIKVGAQNKANEINRWDLRMEVWTKVYTLFKKSTERTAEVTSRELKVLCDLSSRGIVGGYCTLTALARIESSSTRLATRAREDHQDRAGQGLL